MSDIDEGAERIAIIVVSYLFVATLCVIFSCYRICKEGHRRKKEQQLARNETEPSRLEVAYNPQNRDCTETQQSTDQTDFQLIFGRTSVNNTSPASNVSNASNTEELARERLSDLQNAYERRAQERRNNLQRNSSISSQSAPPYNLQDDTLPTYEQIVRTQ